MTTNNTFPKESQPNERVRIRTVNKLVKLDTYIYIYPLPKIDYLFSQLAGKKDSQNLIRLVPFNRQCL